MSNQLLMGDYPLVVLPGLAQKIGLNQAVFLQQLHYWMSHKNVGLKREGKTWVYNTYDEWQKQFPFWSAMTIRRVVSKLEDMNLLSSFVGVQGKRTTFYTLNYDELEKLTNPVNIEIVPDEAEASTDSNQVGEDSPMSTRYEEIRNQSSIDEKATPPENPQSDQPEQVQPINMNTSIYTETPPETSSFSSQEVQIESQRLEAKKKKKNENDEVWEKWMSVWDEKVVSRQRTDQKTRKSPAREAKLQWAYIHIFHQSLPEWEAYCEKIRKNQYLMGDNAIGFQVSIDWALKPDNAVRVLEGSIYSLSNQEEDKEFAIVSTFKELENTLGDTTEGLLWLNVCKDFARQEGFPAMKLWLCDCKIVELTPRKVVVSAPDEFKKSWIRDNYGGAIQKILAERFPDVVCEFIKK